MVLFILGPGLFEDGDIGVGVFPERQEILVGGAGFRGVALEGVGSGDAEMRQGGDGFVEHHAAMFQDPGELGGFGSTMRGQVGFAADVDGIP